MANAFWLLVALPLWYFASVASPFTAVSLVPAVGALSLVIGLALSFFQRRRELLFFLIPLALSELLMIIAGAMRGQGHLGQASPVLVNFTNGGLFVFMAVQVAVSAYLLCLLKGARSAAAALAIFSVTYAAAAAFVAGMSFTDVWI
jgi:hypothetical protein